MSYINNNYDVFENVFNALDKFTALSTKVPVVDILEEEDKFSIVAEVPGLTLEDINVEVDNHVLTIEKGESVNNKEVNYILKERKPLEFKRRFTLPENVDEDKIQGSIKNGILTINIPKKEIPKAKKINVVIQ